MFFIALHPKLGVIITWICILLLLVPVLAQAFSNKNGTPFFGPTSFRILIDLSTTTSNPQDEGANNHNLERLSTLLADGWICNKNDSSTLSSSLLQMDRRKPCLVRLSPNDNAAQQPSIKGVVLSCDNAADLEPSLDWDDTDSCIVIVEEKDGTSNKGLPPRFFKDNHVLVRCLVGDAATAFHLLQRRQGDDTHGVFVWKPPSATNLEDWQDLVINVYQMRSLGCAGLVLSLPWKEWSCDKDDDIVHALNRIMLKFQRPCSAMDYPPTIYMIGEDEIR